MMKHKSWWESLSKEMRWVATIVAGLAALGTVIVVLSKYITLPDRVEAAEKMATAQQKQIDELKAIEDTWQKIYQRQQQSAPPNAPHATIQREMVHPLMEQDKHAVWWCCGTTREDCWARQTWYHCEEH